jgi:hypothetical protein
MCRAAAICNLGCERTVLTKEFPQCFFGLFSGETLGGKIPLSSEDFALAPSLYKSSEMVRTGHLNTLDLLNNSSSFPGLEKVREFYQATDSSVTKDRKRSREFNVFWSNSLCRLGLENIDQVIE